MPLHCFLRAGFVGATLAVALPLFRSPRFVLKSRAFLSEGEDLAVLKGNEKGEEKSPAEAGLWKDLSN